jgi:glutathione synthase/RimK-type ligase-like ATP-grasp enzyme
VYQRKYQYVASKWKKATLLLQDETISPYIPDTRLFIKHDLLDMLNRYPVVYIKPDEGMKGKGIICISNNEAGYMIKTTSQTLTVDSLERLYRKLFSIAKKYRLIVQQGVNLIRYREQPIDFRILMQKPRNKWVYCGIVGKLGGKGSIVTNYASGGRAVPFGGAIYQTLHVEPSKIKQLRDEIRTLCYKVCTQLTSVYPGLRELGIDIAVDQSGDIWILEVNTTPGHQLFRDNAELYRRISRNVHLINSKS